MLGAQAVDVDARQRVADDRHVVVEQTLVGETHRASDAAEEFGVADRLADGLDGLLVPAEPQVTPGEVHVDRLDLGGGRQHDVGVAGGVGEELFVHDREQVVAGHALASCLDVGHDDQRVAVPDDHRLHRWLGVEQDLTEATHVEGAWVATRQQVGSGERVAVLDEVLPRADAAGDAAAPVTPGPGECRQARHGAEEHAAVLVVLGPDERADRRRADRRVVPRQAFDVGCRDTALGLGPRGCALGDVSGEFVESEGVVGDPVGIDESVADDDVHHRQHQRDVGSGQWLQHGVVRAVGGLGGQRADRVDHDEAGSGGPGLLDRRPQMAVGDLGVGAPQDDEA